MSPIDRIAQVAASQRRLDNYVSDLAAATGQAVGQLGAMERAKLEGRLGPMDATLNALLGGATSGMASGPVASTLGNASPTIGQGNALTEPMFDTVISTTLGTSEAAVSLDWWGKYVHTTGTALTHTIDYVPWSDFSNNSTSSSMLAYKATSSASGTDTASLYTKSAVTLSDGSPAMPYIVAGVRIVHLPGSVLTNLTTATATLELVRDSGTVERSVVYDLLTLPLGANIYPTGWVASPTILRLTGDTSGWNSAKGHTYDLRVKINVVASGANATGLRIALAEPTISFSYSQDPIPFLPDRAGSRFWFGDGSDGTVTIASGTTTLARDMLYENLGISAGATLAPNGWHVFCRNRLVNRGTISRDGAVGAAGSVNMDGDGGAASVAGLLGPGTDGGDGGYFSVTPNEGAASSSPGDPSIGGYGGNGNRGSSSGALGGDGAYTVYSALNGTFRAPMLAMMGRASAAWASISGGAGGGGGGAGATGGGGGGGGAGGGVIAIAARFLDNAGGTIRANGGAGGNGATNDGTQGGGGGGGGGGGIILVYDSIIKGTETCTPGALGTGGTGSDAAASGQILYIRG